MARVSQVVVLAEDERQQRLIRRYLNQLKYTAREIRFEAVSSGRGSGEAWVRARYALAVKAFRWRSARAETSLIVAIDADRGSVSQRSRQLDDALASEGLPLRAAGERIVNLIPKRNIETWILNLNGRAVEEEADFGNAPGIDEQIESAAQALFEWTRPNAAIPDFCVPSLHSAIPEIGRLEHKP